MFRITLLSLFISTAIFAQNYRWPIRASQSLSATFCEYRDGHLHAGIDIKTWGEMEVPCFAIADGYIERIIVGYNGYGRGLFLRLNDGNVAVYGHLELFPPAIEALIKAEQLKDNRHRVRLKFGPDKFKVKAGDRVAYSGTSGTEHPHLHFEIRDSINAVINPQLFYPNIKDKRKPILDEIMLHPIGLKTRINNSMLPVIIDAAENETPINITGPFRTSINAHDRANGTLNKYNIYRADAFVNDSLIFAYRFDRVPRELTDSITAVYPGMRGKRGWRFMSMSKTNDSYESPLTLGDKHGRITPVGISTLKIRLADIHRNINAMEFVIRSGVNEVWEVKSDHGDCIITRSYPDSGYERFQFYSRENELIPIAQTFYRMNSTSWRIDKSKASQGVRALGALGGEVKWVIPPENQPQPDISHQWIRKNGGYILRLSSETPYVYPLAFHLKGSNNLRGSLFQTAPGVAEFQIIPLESRALAHRVDLQVDSTIIYSYELKPMTKLVSGDSTTIALEQFGIALDVNNSGEQSLFLTMDTLTAEFDDQLVTGVSVRALSTNRTQLDARLTFQHDKSTKKLFIFTPGKKAKWKLLKSEKFDEHTSLNISKSGEYFLLPDDKPPVVTPQKKYSKLRRGNRMVFNIKDNTGKINYRNGGFSASLDGQVFFPDYNPLRKELSFHVPKKLSLGDHQFEVSLKDYADNEVNYSFQFTVSR